MFNSPSPPEIQFLSQNNPPPGGSGDDAPVLHVHGKQARLEKKVAKGKAVKNVVMTASSKTVENRIARTSSSRLAEQNVLVNVAK